MPERIICPVCGRPDRSVTKSGKIRDHDSNGQPPGTRTRFCAAGGMTVDEATVLAVSKTATEPRNGVTLDGQ